MSTIKPSATIPKYGNRKNWKPRCEADFGGGGAYPEIHMPQYPLDMGRQEVKKDNSIPVQYDSQGNIKYDILLRQSKPRDHYR